MGFNSVWNLQLLFFVTLYVTNWIIFLKQVKIHDEIRFIGSFSFSSLTTYGYWCCFNAKHNGDQIDCVTRRLTLIVSLSLISLLFREKLAVARLQREVARSKSEGTMVKYSGTARPVICTKPKKPHCAHFTHIRTPTHTLSTSPKLSRMPKSIYCFNTFIIWS